MKHLYNFIAFLMLILPMLWIENYNFDEINSMDYKDVRIAIVAPEELKVQTSNKSLLTQYSYKKTLATDYANN